MLCYISTSLIEWVANLRRGGTMAAFAHVDVPGPLLPQLGRLLAEFEKDVKGAICCFWAFPVSSREQ